MCARGCSARDVVTTVVSESSGLVTGGVMIQRRIRIPRGTTHRWPCSHSTPRQDPHAHRPRPHRHLRPRPRRDLPLPPDPHHRLRRRPHRRHCLGKGGPAGARNVSGRRSSGVNRGNVPRWLSDRQVGNRASPCRALNVSMVIGPRSATNPIRRRWRVRPAHR